MNERQNPDGSWSKAEPIKASWETNRLLELFKKFKRMFSRFTKPNPNSIER